MPGRKGYQTVGGWAGVSSSGGAALPQSLTLDNRTGGDPLEYKASYEIDFVPDFLSASVDNFEAYITQGDNGGGGEGGTIYGTAPYRYGFNGKENDDEVKGEGGQQDYGARIYDSRLGRFLSFDPLAKLYPWYTPYQFAGNMPIWAIDLDGGEEKKTTEFKAQEIVSYNFNKMLSEDQIKSKIADQIYLAIDKQIPSKAERINVSSDQTKSPRYNGETALIKAEIKKYIVVDLEGQYSAVYSPETKEPELVYKIGKGLFEFANSEGQPILAKAAGTAAYNVGNAIIRVTNNIESYKKDFYKKYFPKQFSNASNINTTLNKFTGKALKGVGLVFKTGAKTLDVIGTIGMAYEVINPNRGPMTDDELKNFTKSALEKYLSEQAKNNSNTNQNAQGAASSPQSVSEKKKG